MVFKMNIGTISEGGGSIPTATVLDYLQPEINRPDLYEERSFVIKDIRGPSSSSMKKRDVTDVHKTKMNAPLYTIAIIILSAVIFITLVSWADVLRSWFDTKYINPIIGQQLKSRIYYASTITIIGFIVLIVLGLWYYYLR